MSLPFILELLESNIIIPLQHWIQLLTLRAPQNINHHNNHRDGNRYLLFNDHHFKQEFRISRHLFNHILQQLDIQPHHYGRKAISAELSLMIFLTRLSQGTSVRQLSTKFGVSVGSVVRSFELINALFYNKFIHHISLSTGDELTTTKNYFLVNFQLPRVIGAIDGTHILLQKVPHNDPVSYYNRKQTHSVILQILADEKFIIHDVNVGWPGSVPDSSVYKHSSLRNRLLQTDHIILGDSGYKLSMNVLTPYSYIHTDDLSVRYNTKHAAARVVVEQTFAMLKNRWRILKMLSIQWSESAALAVTNCCILHNMCVKYDNDRFQLSDNGNDDGIDNNDISYVNDNQNDELARHQRDAIAELMS